MAQEVIVTGRDEGFDYYEQLRLEQLLAEQEEARRREQEAFAPPAPTLLPEVPVTADPLTGIPFGFMVAMEWVLGRLVPILVPQPTGPASHDELDEFDVMWTPPPPKPPGATATDPIMPPNWNDLVQWPGTPVMVPITPVNLGPVEMPPGEKYFDVSPPQPTKRDDVLLLPPLIEVPLDPIYGFPFGAPGLDIDIDPGPGPAPAPTSPPGSYPDAFPLEPFVEPSRRPQPDRPGTSAPDPLSAPLPDVVGNPFGNPGIEPTVPTTPGRQPRTPGVPLSPFDPLAPFIEQPTPLEQFQPEKTRYADTCNCAKKKKKKPKKDREICYRGTYYETKRGLSKQRMEQVPCEEHAPKRSRSTSGGKSAAKPKKKLKPGQFPGLGLLGSENLSASDWLELGSHALKEFAPIIFDALKPKKAARATKKRNRRPKSKLPTLPGTIYSTPFPQP